MSELTPCNFCTLRRIKARAKEKGWKVLLISNGLFGIDRDGIDVYVHPKNIKTADIEADAGKYGRYWQAWFMELSDQCAC